MLDRAVVHIELSEQEREALKRLMARRKTAQDMALRARIVLTCAEGLSSKKRRSSVSAFVKRRSENRAVGFRKVGSTGFTTRRVRAVRAPSPTIRLRLRWFERWRASRRTPHTGHRGRWRRRAGFRPQRAAHLARLRAPAASR